MRTVADFELVNHGVMHEDYFQGCGRRYGFSEVETGCGSNPADAIDDLLEALANKGVETDGLADRINKQYSKRKTPKTPRARADSNWFYLSLCYNLE